MSTLDLPHLVRVCMCVRFRAEGKGAIMHTTVNTGDPRTEKLNSP